MDKIVNYDEFCSDCKFYPCDPGNDDNPCNDCLGTPVNTDSHKPIHFKDKND